VHSGPRFIRLNGEYTHANAEESGGESCRIESDVDDCYVNFIFDAGARFAYASYILERIPSTSNIGDRPFQSESVSGSVQQKCLLRIREGLGHGRV